MDVKDIVEIQQLIALYGHAADNPKQGLLPRVFSEDAIWEAPGSSFQGVEQNRFVGLQAIIDLFDMGVPPNSPSHHSTNVYVYEEGGQTKVRSKWIAHPEKRSVWMGDYEDVVVRTPNGWRIKHRVAFFRYTEE